MAKQNLQVECDGFLAETPFDLAKNSSIGVGGMAKIAFFPRNVAELAALLQYWGQEGKEYYVVGNMTNILPADQGTSKILISTKRLVGTQVGDKTFAYAGEQSGRFLRVCRSAQKSGAEFLAGIPCTIGGALYMNAGVKGAYISEIVDSVLVFREGELRTLQKEECAYSYKNSVFMQNKDVIVGATFCLTDESEQEIENRTNAFLKRRAHLPKGKSMGCVFKNSEGIAAGELIEKAGLKGLRLGGAKISETHANFIINEDHATESEIKTLIGMIKNAVFSQYGVTLTEEIRYLE